MSRLLQKHKRNSPKGGKSRLIQNLTQKVKPNLGDIKISSKKITRSQVRYGDINIITKRDTESSPIGGHIKIFTKSKTHMKSRPLGDIKFLKKFYTQEAKSDGGGKSRLLQKQTRS
jgi:hypothetical protein